MEIRTSSDTRSRPDLPTRRPPRGLVRNVTSRLYYVPRSPDASVDVLNYITSRPYKTFRLSGFSTVHYIPTVYTRLAHRTRLSRPRWRKSSGRSGRTSRSGSASGSASGRLQTKVGSMPWLLRDGELLWSSVSCFDIHVHIQL